MKKTLSIILLACAATGVHAQQSSSIKTSPSDKDIVIGSPDDTTANRGKIFTAVEQEPSFPGGHDGFTRFLIKNIRYPPTAAEKRIQGNVYLTFIVERDGSLSDIRVIRSVSPDLDAEALRVMKMSPKWSPGIQNYKAVRVQYSMPISFTLE
ncbi:MAG: energy transducer TonB [Bacteroidetes bacterium]|nr:energy transducer TonB [Bacteroidota bacterium]